MRTIIFTITTLFALLVFVACGANESDTNNNELPFHGLSFAEARQDFTTTLTRQVTNSYTIPQPPEGVFSLVHFQSKVGSLAAFISDDPNDGQLHPLIIWVVGGWSNGISDLPWSYGAWDNDQTGAAFREGGILMMYPSFRGANGNLGYHESLYGEIDDIVAAFEFAAALPYVDPSRIYLAGHSTGATRVILAAAYTDVFRAVFAFGSVDDISEHNRAMFTFDLSDNEERMMRSPIFWLDDITTPAFIIEGRYGNAQSLENMKNATTNSNVHIHIIEGGDHFDMLAPITKLVAQRILADVGAASNISFTDQELQTAMNQPPISPMPIMLPHHNEEIGVSFLLPFAWGQFREAHMTYTYTAAFFDENLWESSYLFLDAFDISFSSSYELDEWLGFDEGFDKWIININGQEVPIWAGHIRFRGEVHFNIAAAFQTDNQLTIFDFLTPQTFADSAEYLFTQIINSITFD